MALGRYSGARIFRASCVLCAWLCKGHLRRYSLKLRSLVFDAADASGGCDVCRIHTIVDGAMVNGIDSRQTEDVFAVCRSLVYIHTSQNRLRNAFSDVP